MPRLALPARLNGSFRQALGWAGALMLVSLAAMALAMALGLGRADRLLDRLGRSQDQLAQVTRIEADINALMANLATSARPPEALAADAAEIEARLTGYRRSIEGERQVLESTPVQAANQDDEIRNAEILSRLFAGLKGDVLNATGGPSRIDAERRSIEALAREVASRERAESLGTIEAMRRLRGQVTWLGAAIPLVVGIFGAAGALIMLASLVRPLEVLKAAAARAGRGETPAPVTVQGFAELRAFAEAFNRMETEIAAQREALSQANVGLEAQVRERTKEIEASREKLAEIDRTRRLFFSKLSHELRTPATVIRGEAEVALRDAKAPASRLREALEHVVANGAFLQRRLEDMLALARAEDGRVALQRDPVDLSAVVRQTVALAEPYIRSSGMILTAELPEAAGPTILGDASWLQQALLALVDNAAKFAAGSETIRFSLNAEDGEARIVVADGGPGVAPEDLPFLFDSYYQAPGAPGSGAKARGGSGLGLSIARWVAEQHGGTITAANDPERGLVIEIRLPVSA